MKAFYGRPPFGHVRLDRSCFEAHMWSAYYAGLRRRRCNRDSRLRLGFDILHLNTVSASEVLGVQGGAWKLPTLKISGKRCAISVNRLHSSIVNIWRLFRDRLRVAPEIVGRQVGRKSSKWYFRGPLHLVCRLVRMLEVGILTILSRRSNFQVSHKHGT